MRVNLKANPYFLSDDDCRWVEDTISSMSPEEKVGQLFFAITASYDEDYLKNLLETYHVGGCRYNAQNGEAVWKHNDALQRNSKIPLIIATNTEAGGNDACKDGTPIGSGIKIGATGKKEYAYALGKMANEQAAAVGCNMAFAPVCDIALNWRNTEIVNRSFGNDPKRVAEMSVEYLKGAHTIEGYACAAKHFPGNGMDFRDAHLSNNVNDMSVEEWEATYGEVYRSLIDNGLDAFMAGHIMLPAYAKTINPDLKDEDMLPATLSPEIMTVLLREKLGFNGMVVTDASHMVGMTCRMKRAEMLPTAINAGCDMLLFFNDADEDFATVLAAYKNGTISEERMEEALTRILGLKAHMGLHKKKPEERVAPFAQVKEVLGREAYAQMQHQISEDGITLVKYLDKDVLPITPEKYKRIMLVHIKGVEDGMTALMKAVGMSGPDPTEMLKQKLEAKGFEVFIYENPMDIMKKELAAGKKPNFNVFFAGKDAIADFTAKMDLVITVCDVASGRPCFGLSKGGGEIPWYVFEVPTIVLGCEAPTMLADIPQARTYINLYDTKEPTLDVLVEKLTEGPAVFKGKDPIDSFCGLTDTHY